MQKKNTIERQHKYTLMNKLAGYLFIKLKHESVMLLN